MFTRSGEESSIYPNKRKVIVNRRTLVILVYEFWIYIPKVFQDIELAQVMISLLQILKHCRYADLRIVVKIGYD